MARAVLSLFVMKPPNTKQAIGLAALLPLAVSVTGCAAVEGIFKAGVWVGVIAVALVLGLAFGLVRMLGG